MNKTNLKAFLGSTWKEKAKTRLAGDQKLVLAGCFIHSDDRFAITQNQETPLVHLLSDNEEADTRILLHASDCSRESFSIPQTGKKTYFIFLLTFVLIAYLTHISVRSSLKGALLTKKRILATVAMETRIISRKCFKMKELIKLHDFP